MGVDRGEDRLRESERRFRLVIDSVTDYAIFMLDPEGIVASWNTGGERLKGYRPDEIIGRHFSLFYTQDDIQAHKPDDELVRAAAEGRVEDEGWRVRKDGSVFWANVVITALRDADGKLQGYAKVTRDLTDRKNAEDALRGVLERERETATRLREVDRMKSDFVAMVAHDGGSPMSVISGFADALLASWADVPDDEKRDIVSRIQRNAAHLSGVLTDVLEVARIESGEMRYQRERFDIQGVIERAIRDTQAASPSARIEPSTPSTPLMVMADENRTWQVVMNLLSNAVKWTAAGDPIGVASRTIADGDVQVSVEDHGPGIAPEDQEKVFGRFIRLTTRERTTGGTGLGLYIAKEMVEAQGGRIWLDSEVGRGSTFHFTLPGAG